MARRTSKACYHTGMAIGEFKRDLIFANFAASEGATDMAREILKTSRSQAMKLKTARLMSGSEVEALRAKLDDAITQKTASMVERKTKYILQREVEALEKKAKKKCLGSAK